MRRRFAVRPAPSLWGWIGVASVVVGYDGWALRGGHETLSAAWWRNSEKRVRKTVLSVTWLGLTWHLLVGHKRILSDKYHLWYLKVHPLWVVHDRLVGRGKIPAKRP